MTALRITRSCGCGSDDWTDDGPRSGNQSGTRCHA
jgi:hypothetical protein